MSGIFPDPTVAQAWTTIAQVRAWAGLSEEVYNSVIVSTGDLGTEPRFLAMLPGPVWRAAISAAPYDPGTGARELTPTEAARAGVLWRVVQRLAWSAVGNDWATYIDIDPCIAPAPAAVAPAAAAAAAPQTPAGRKIKLNNVLDQGDETEIAVQSPQRMTVWNQNYITATGGLPDEDVRASVDQITALAYRCEHSMTPYADFGVFGQYYRRANRAGKFRTWIPLGNGTYLTKELSGPENHQQWQGSYRVYSVALLSLQEATVLSLERYERNIEKLVVDYPEAWHLVVVAEDKMRAEHFEVLRTRVVQSIADGSPAPRDWNPLHPWIAIFRLAAEDRDYWDEQVRRLAGIWLQRGGRGCPLAPDEQVARTTMAGGIAAIGATPLPAGPVSHSGFLALTDGTTSKYTAEERKERAKVRKAKKTAAKIKVRELRNARTSGGASNANARQPAGPSTQACFSFSKKGGPCANAAPGSTCPNGRKHCCHVCGGAHQAGDPSCRGGGGRPRR